MQKLPMISWLGVISLVALPSYAQSRRVVADDIAGVGTTYTPNDASSSVDSYSERGSAVRTNTARGGGPAPSSGILHSRTMAGEHRRIGLDSDNQTRRPGSINYKTGALDVRFAADHVTR